MAKTYELRCGCEERVLCDEAGLQAATKRCEDCKTIPLVRVKLAVEDTYSWKKSQ